MFGPVSCLFSGVGTKTVLKPFSPIDRTDRRRQATENKRSSRPFKVTPLHPPPYYCADEALWEGSARATEDDASEPNRKVVEMSTISFKVRFTNGDTAEVKDVDPDLSIKEVKALLHARNLAGVEPDKQRLIFKGRILSDEQTLSAVGVQDGLTIHLVKSLKSTTAAPSASPSAAPAAAPAPTGFGGGIGGVGGGNAWPYGGGGGGGGAGLGAGAGGFNPFAAMGGMGGGGMGGGGMGLPPGMPAPSPEMMRQVMENPMVQQMLENPEMMRSMIQSNPMMRAMIEQNPQIEHVLTDPQLMRQAMQAAANPALMQELMRSQDRALANIEALPGGHNALRRMYEQEIDPMVQAAEATQERLHEQQQQQRTPGAPSSASNAAGGPAAAPMPNPWSRPQTTQPAGGAPAANPFAGAFGGGGGAANPWLAGAGGQGAADNPMMQMMQDPVYMQRLMDPANMQAMMQLQQALDQLRRGGILPENLFPPSYNSFLGAMGGNTGMPGGTNPMMPAAPTPVAPLQPPEVRFASQLTQLENMGFIDRERNIQALTATNGNVNAAIERLLQ